MTELIVCERCSKLSECLQREGEWFCTPCTVVVKKQPEAK